MLQHTRKGSTLLVRISGELDHYCAQRVRRDLDTLLLDQSVRTMVLDLAEMTFMDSSGIGVLLGRYRILRDRGGLLCVTHMNPQVAKLFHMAGMDRVIRPLNDAPQEVRS